MIRNPFGDEAALVHVAGDPLLIRRHARSGRHCQTAAKSTKRHNTKTIRAKSTTRNVQQDAEKNKNDGWRSKFRNINEMTNDHVAQQTKREQANISGPRAPNVQCWHALDEVGVA